MLRLRPAPSCLRDRGPHLRAVAIDALPRLAATYVATATDGITDSNLETARMDEYFEGFGRRFWSALAKFKAHRASR